MKKLWTILLAALLLLACAAPALADGETCVYDLYGLLSEEEAAALQNRAAEISGKYDCGVYLVVLSDYRDYGYSPAEAAESIYRDSGFGRYRDSSGVLLMMSMSDRDYYVYHLGFGTYAAELWGESRMDAPMLQSFRVDDWYGGFSAFLDTCDEMLEYAESSYDPADYNPDGTPVRRPPPIGVCVVGGLIIGCIVAFIVCSAAKAGMRSVRSAGTAAAYAGAEGLNLYQRDDVFSHVTQTRTRIESESSRGGGGGRPSGGGGGHGGKF